MKKILFAIVALAATSNLVIANPPFESLTANPRDVGSSVMARKSFSSVGEKELESQLANADTMGSIILLNVSDADRKWLAGLTRVDSADDVFIDDDSDGSEEDLERLSPVSSRKANFAVQEAPVKTKKSGFFASVVSVVETAVRAVSKVLSWFGF